MVDHVLQLPAETPLMILSPLIIGRKGEQTNLLDELRAQGFVRVRIDGTVHEIDALPKLKKNIKHTVEVVVDVGVEKNGMFWLICRPRHSP